MKFFPPVFGIHCDHETGVVNINRSLAAVAEAGTIALFSINLPGKAVFPEAQSPVAWTIPTG